MELIYTGDFPVELFLNCLTAILFFGLGAIYGKYHLRKKD